jgi:tryptophanyl-tRNA synthetase
MEQKKRIFSAVKPTGRLTIGNYIGAIKNMVMQQEEYDCFYAVADMHSLTVDILPALLRKNSLDTLALFVACGISPEKSTLFIQSHVPAHAELTWILNCSTMLGEASRMTQFKDKSRKSSSVNLGLFDYPVLMAADILLYSADYVPIGKDQKQHLELSKTIAARFNGRYSDTFVVPEGIYPKHGGKIFSLLDPTAKMGKTDENENGTVFLLDDADTVMRKFKRAVTDSGSEIVFRADKAGISNLITIYMCFTGKSLAETEREFQGVSYAAFKEAVGEAVNKQLSEIQQKYQQIIVDKNYMGSIMNLGREKAAFAARKMLDKVYRKVGFVRL